jgi:putative selenate reductase
MSDRFQPVAADAFVAWVFDELKNNGSLFGIPKDLFYTPGPRARFAQTLYDRPLETPLGVAAGPHSQMAQNIIVAWLCGARFIELKTVQTLDEIEVSKPCIDMQDEGYNVEWSQELKVEQSFDEYMRAWVLIHALHRHLGFPGEVPGVIFNMSVGYNMEGLLKPNMQWYLKRMADAKDARDYYVGLVAKYFPDVRNIAIPSRMTHNVTLSTMHGCPPNEIEQISEYLINEWNLHTSVKLNPTLLGPDRLRSILNQELGYKDVVVPDLAFEHDLKYADGAPMLKRLRERAAARGLQFGVKLSNTLEVENHRDAFSAKEKMMYMSGRALHAVTVNLAAKLAEEFGGALMMSFSAGADAFNVADVLSCGVRTVTVCSDILKPGGYLRLLQYLENLDQAMGSAGATDLRDFVCKSAAASGGPAGSGPTDPHVAACALHNVKRYAQKVLSEPHLKKAAVDASRTKTNRALGLYDCIMAPCVDECPINQKVPQYMNLVREGRFEEAVEITRLDNPMPTVLGRACNHLCENLCIRTHYDEPLAIREMKRFIMDQEKKPCYRPRDKTRNTKIAVIGGGPCGLSAAYFLAQAGYAVAVFEARAYTGGMVSGTIPAYRAKQAVIEQDMEIIRQLGVEIRYNQKAGRDFTMADLRGQGFKYIVIGVGAQRGRTLGVDGEKSEGVLDALEFLRNSKEGHPPALGSRVGVIGGGDVAMDCARTAWRLTGAKVTIIYRRTIEEMPAAREEIVGALDEGCELIELVKPVRVEARDGKMTGLVGLRMKLGDKDSSGRRRPVDIPGSEFTIPLDNLIVAISQEPELEFLGDEPFEKNRQGYLQVNPATMETSVSGVFAGGDIALDGPESIVKAMGDGRRIAEVIHERESGIRVDEKAGRSELSEETITDLIRRRARRAFRVPLPHRPTTDRKHFDEVEFTLSEEAAKEEASRCIDCHLICSTCVTVCPNLAFMTYRMPAFETTLPQVRLLHGEIAFGGGKCFRVEQQLQVAVQTDFCNECGNCATFCPTAGKPYKDKPRLYLNWNEFQAEKDNAFMLLRSNGTWGIKGRFNGETHTLLLGGEAVYTSPRLKAKLHPETLDLHEAVPTNQLREGETVSLEPCAVMFVLLNGLKTSKPFLPTAEV